MTENESYIEEEDKYDWIPICTKDGFLYFYNKSTGECQWSFPKIYNSITKKYENIL